MKAIVYTQYGSQDVLTLKDIDKPVPKENEILVKVHATTVNRTDCATLTAKPFIMRFFLGLFKPKKPILGTEFAGDIEAVGKTITSFKKGDRVFGFGDYIVGSYARYMVISADRALTTIPESIPYEQAAASIEGAHYAYNFLNKTVIRNGQKVLVNGATGGIGSAMVQLLKTHKAHVTAVCSTKNIELVKSLGAARVIDYTKVDFTKDTQKYDFVFDAVGKSTFGKCKRLLKPGGVYISSEFGPVMQNLFFSMITAIVGSVPGQGGKKVLFPYPSNIIGSVLYIKNLIEEGKFNPVIDRTYPLEQIADAFEYVLKGQKTGNVVITLDDM